jgi:hypothetical protein
VSLLVIPEAMTYTLNGLYDVLNSFGPLSTHDYALPRQPPFRVEMVALARGPAPTASGCRSRRTPPSWRSAGPTS